MPGSAWSMLICRDVARISSEAFQALEGGLFHASATAHLQLLQAVQDLLHGLMLRLAVAAALQGDQVAHAGSNGGSAAQSCAGPAGPTVIRAHYALGCAT